MKKYLKIYQMVLRLNFSQMITYRGNFFSDIVSSMSWGIFSIIIILLLTGKTSTVFGWTRGELVILTLAYNVIIGIFQTFFTDNFERLSQTIHYAELDGLLIKPIDSQFLVTTKYMSFTTLSRVIVAILVGIFLLNSMHVAITIFSAVFFVILGAVGLLILYSIWFFISTLMIWFPTLSNLVDFLYQITGIARYPREMSKQLPVGLASAILPIALVVVVPVKILLQKNIRQEIYLFLLLAIILNSVSRFFWKFALRYYTSASG